ncbi:hypothetical protein DFH29DRAFT_320520 [Suillus ampliporus]|nr:hypothetical protein DFH29DRAFT_320520 [Suillus ampliporus]
MHFSKAQRRGTFQLSRVTCMLELLPCSQANICSPPLCTSTFTMHGEHYGTASRARSENRDIGIGQTPDMSSPHSKILSNRARIFINIIYSIVKRTKEYKYGINIRFCDATWTCDAMRTHL